MSTIQTFANWEAWNSVRNKINTNFTNLNDDKLEDAPSNGNSYVRKDWSWIAWWWVNSVNWETWTVLLDTSIIPEWWSNLYFTSAERSKLAWISWDLVEEAPEDGKQYVRRDWAWEEVVWWWGWTWWSITWTLSDQIDLQAALDAKEDNLWIVSLPSQLTSLPTEEIDKIYYSRSWETFYVWFNDAWWTYIIDWVYVVESSNWWNYKWIAIWWWRNIDLPRVLSWNTPTDDYDLATKKYVDDNSGWWWSVTTLDILEIPWTQTTWIISKYRVSQSWTLAKFSAYLETAPTWANFIVVVKINWTTQATATITAWNNSWTTTSFTSSTLSEWDLVTYEITQIGSTVAWADLTLALNLS